MACVCDGELAVNGLGNGHDLQEVRKLFNCYLLHIACILLWSVSLLGHYLILHLINNVVEHVSDGEKFRYLISI
jgi:hypothetical protein